jgi:very-short-patch-repair endonuclease
MDAPKATINRARALRRRMTRLEARLWTHLRRKARGLRFRRQHPIGPFVLDFYCDAVRLAVEVDGASHGRGDSPLRDMERDAWLALRRIRVLRLAARTVLQDVDAAIRMIEHAAAAGPPIPPHR